jgi:hypothetical protein
MNKLVQIIRSINGDTYNGIVAENIYGRLYINDNFIGNDTDFVTQKLNDVYSSITIECIDLMDIYSIDIFHHYKNNYNEIQERLCIHGSFEHQDVHVWADYESVTIFYRNKTVAIPLIDFANIKDYI